MRTKNAKRLWLVPATLAVMAVAALLAFGLMATTGAQPAAAQDDADCELTFTTAGILDEVVHDTSIVTNLGRPITCEAKGGTATVQVNGPLMAFTEQATEFVRFYIEDNSGALAVFAPGQMPSWNITTNRYEIDSVAASTKKYRFLQVDIPAVETNPRTGRPARGSATFTVNKSKGGVVYIYTGAVLELTEPEDTNNPPEERQQRGLINAQGTATITFLGAPAIGKDLDTDYNKKLEDDLTSVQQCQLTGDTDKEIVGEAIDCTAAGLAPAGVTWAAIDPNPDQTESRSKLVVRTRADAAEGGTLKSATATPIIDGKMGTHTIEGNDDTVTIYAVVEDENGEALLDTPVSFVSTTMPTGIVPARDLSDDVDTKEAVTASNGALEDDQILVLDLDTDTDTPRAQSCYRWWRRSGVVHAGQLA